VLDEILKRYGIVPGYKAEIISTGLINATWKITTHEGSFILQRVNTNVFRSPEKVAENIDLLSEHARKYPDYLFVGALTTTTGESAVTSSAKEFYRLFEFIPDSHTINKVTVPEEAYEASRQFGKFTTVFSGVDATRLHITIPGFHDLSWRNKQFQDSLKNGNPDRISRAKELCEKVAEHAGILSTYNKLTSNRAFKKRVTHHDTKISNVLYDQNNKGLCVIDLDTVMPGYYISDVGDMMRTYLAIATEEETDIKKIEIRMDVFKAIVQGYLETMHTVLSKDELDHFVYSGSFLTYMQALRFLTDYLNDDRYYGAKYPEHNYDRALNQLTLLSRIEERKLEMQEIVAGNM
jgi:Ser/Thr protein kinase RdoA (MazF antagonist)